MFPKIIATISILFFTMSLSGQLKTHPIDQSKELGNVTWFRNYDEAVQEASDKHKDILILFQEVPGCATCKNYATNVLTHPLMVDAIENEFIPLVIYNNKGGNDAQILKKFDEPSWNNPVVRIVNTDGEGIVPRIAGDYSINALYQAMVVAIKTRKKEIPAYMNLLKEEIDASYSSNETYYKMYCFWSGEKHLGHQTGVVSTEAGFMGGHEVVKVLFDKNVITQKQLDKYASKGKCQPIEKENNYRIDKDPQYYLKNSDYRHLPLSTIQKTKINSLLGHGKDPFYLLSPTQKYWFENSNASIEFYNQDFTKAWAVKKYR